MEYSIDKKSILLYNIYNKKKHFRGCIMVDVQDYADVSQIDEDIAALRERRKELKASQKEAERQKAKAEKQARLDEAKAYIESLELEEGDDVKVVLKGETVDAQFVHVTDARIVVLVDGDKKTLPFDKFVSQAGEQEAVSEEPETVSEVV